MNVSSYAGLLHIKKRLFIHQRTAQRYTNG